MAEDKKAQKDSSEIEDLLDGIDLEAPGMEVPEEEPLVEAEEDVVPSGETGMTVSEGSSLEELYDRYSKLVYLVDISGSMATNMAPEKPDSPTRLLPPRSKLQAVQAAAREFVKKRFRRHPDAEVLVMAFNMGIKLLTKGVGEQAVLASIDDLTVAGGTDIMFGLRGALAECCARPSTVGAHHIVLISDGMDYQAADAMTLAKEMLQRNIVLDFIYVEVANIGSYDNATIEALTALCETTGGEFSTVARETDFAQKFFQVSDRKLLPPASV